MGSEALHDVPEGQTPADPYHWVGAQVEPPLIHAPTPGRGPRTSRTSKGRFSTYYDWLQDAY
jgi:hypothetical protein